MSILYYVTAGADDGHIYGSSGFNNSDSWIYFGYDDATHRNHAFFRFSNLAIPKDAVIDSASLENYMFCTGTTGTINARVYACAEDDSAAVSSYSNYNAKSLTTAYVNWNLVFSDTNLHDFASGDIKTVIQEIVNRSGWASGNHLQIMLKDIGSGSTQCMIDSWEDGNTQEDAMFLHITWHKAVNTSVPAITSITNVFQVPTITGKANVSLPSNINITNVFQVPTLTGKANVSIPSNINITNTFQVPAITVRANINVPVITSITNSCPLPALTGKVNINVPVINTSVGMCQSVSNLVENVIDLRCRMETPIIVESKYLPPDFVFSRIATIFESSRLESYKYELLTLDNGIYKSSGFIDNYVNSANISIDFTRDVIGTLNIDILNNGDINYLSDLIRPYYVLNNLYAYPLGTYMLSTPKKYSDGNCVTRPIVGYDLLLALDQDKTIVSTSFADGINVVDTIKTLLDNVGTWVKYDIVACTETLSQPVSYELGKSTLFIINSLLNMINYYPLWCDGNGTYRGIPWNKDPNKTYEFIDDTFSIYESGIEENIDYTDMYNRVVIINNQLSEDTAALYKVWTFEDEGLNTHPFSYTSIGRYVTKIFDSDAVSQSYVDLRARRELLKMLEAEESINYNHAFVSSRLNDGLPWQNDAYRFKNTLLETDSIYKISGMNLNLEAGNLVQSTIKRIRSTF